MATKKADPTMIEFATTLSKMFEEAQAGKRLIQQNASPELATIFVGKDYKTLALLCRPHLNVDMEQNYAPKEGLIEALDSVGLTLQEDLLEKRFFCVRKKGHPQRLLFWINSDN